MLRLIPCSQRKAAILRRIVARRDEQVLPMFFWGFGLPRGDPACDAARGCSGLNMLVCLCEGSASVQGRPD